jgi:hypothetical protein
MPSDTNPYAPPSQVSLREPQVSEAELNRLTLEATNIFATSLLGILAPVVAVYAIIFLLRHRTVFPRRRLAVTGAILHSVWTLVWIYYFSMTTLAK